MQPPKPAPVIRAATTPGVASAISTRASSSGETTSKSSRSEAWLPAQARPTAARSEAASASIEASTRAFSVTTWRQRRKVSSSTRTATAGSIASVTSRSERMPGSSTASAAAAASHWARRALYCDALRLLVEPVWMTTSACSASGSATGRHASERQSRSIPAPSTPQALANWSISPQFTPTYAFSAR